MSAGVLTLQRSVGRWMDKPVYRFLTGAIWTVALLLLPVTSLPLLKEISGATTVAPPSSALFLLLSAVWLAPYLFTGGRLPLEVKPLLLWLAAGLVSWGAAFFINQPSFRDQTIRDQTLESIVTLAMGLSAYLGAAGWIAADRKRLEVTLKWISIGGIILLAWSLLQAFFVVFADGVYPGWLLAAQTAISSRHDPLFATRLTGLSYEPSWLAHMLALIYLPLWLASSLSGYSISKRRFGFLTVEVLLLALGIITLLLTLSRVGIISLSLMLGFLVLRLVIKWSTGLSSRWLAKNSSSFGGRILRLLLSAAIMFVFLVLMVALVIGFFYLASKFDPRMAKVFGYDFTQVTSFYQLTNQLAIAERVVYWAAGVNIFNDFPVLGVGIGGAGFYFPQKMPGYGYALWEISLLMGYDASIPNTKALWVRVLVETGLVGFAIFAAWLFLLWNTGKLVQRSGDPTLKMTGLAGQLILVAFLAEGFSIDSFALPYIWFALGMLSASGMIARKVIAERALKESYE